MPRRRFVRLRYRAEDVRLNAEEEASTPAVAAPPKSPGNGPYTCEVVQCAKEYGRWKDLKRHQRSHQFDKLHRCDQCDQSFNVEYNLNLHKATHDVENLVCPECKKKFSRVASLKSHIMLHAKEEVLICPECGDEFGLQRSLNEHLQEHAAEATEPKEHTCKICAEKFPMHYMLKEHMRQKHKPRFRSAVMNTKFVRRNLDRSRFHHGCSFCGKSFSKPSQLERHVRIHTGEKPYKCPHCDKAFNQNGALHVHLTKHTGTKPHSCEFCGQKFAQRGNLRAHIVRVHEINSELEQRFECPQCCCNFRKMSSLNAHISRFHNSEEASSPLLSLKAALSAIQEGADWLDSTVDTPALAGALEQLINMLEENAGEGDPLDRIQEIMSGNTINTDILQQALDNSGVTNNVVEGQTETPAPAAPVAPVAPDVPDPAPEIPPASNTAPTVSTETTVAPANNQLNQLFSFVAEILQRRVMVKRSAPTGSRVHTCNYCAKTFKKPSDLVRHVRIHTNEKPYSCTQCDKTFTVKSTLMSHMKTHAGVKEYKCNVCSKLFATHGSLKIHLRLHTGAKPFDCQHCERKFRTTGQRKVHMLCHFKENTEKKTRSAQARAKKLPDLDLPDIPLQEPILITDTGLIQQPPRNSNMYHNYLSDGLQPNNTTDRPYQCTYCQKCFKKSSHLKQHVRSHTGERPYQCMTCMRSFISSGVLKAHERTHVGVKSYKCLICDCLFTTNGSLKRHMSTHTDVRPFMCPYCQKTFKTSVNCKKHMKMHKRELALQAKQQENIDQDPNHVQEIQSIAEQASNLAEHLAIEQASNSILALAQGQLTVGQDGQMANALNETSLASQALAQQSLAQSNLLSEGLTPEALAQAGLTQNYVNAFTQQTLESLASQGDITAENQISLQTQQIQQQLEAITGQSASLFHHAVNIQPVQEELPPPPPQETNRLPTTNTSSVFASNEGEKKTYSCHFCEKTFKKSSHLKQHIRSHTGEKPCKCMQCGRSFVSASTLRNHMRTHSGIKSFKCNLCNTSFTTNGSLVRHMNIHTDQRPHTCQQCGEAFRKQLDLKRHLKDHATESDDGEQLEDGKRPRNVIRFNEEEAQQIAKKPLARNATTSERILVQMVNDKNRVSEVLTQEDVLKRRPNFPNRCIHCSKSFKKPCDLVRHVRTHTGEKPFKCTECERTFAVKSTLVCHVRTHKGGKQEVCHICKTTFATVGSLKVHMRLHTGAKPFKCSHCDEQFRTSGSRKQHTENHFKPATARKRKAAEKVTTNKENSIAQQIIVETAHAEVGQQGSQDLQVSQVQVASDQPVLQAIQAHQLNVSNQPQTITMNSAENGVENAAAVLNGLELQLTGTNLGPNLHIQGLDANNITVQIDPSLLQQIQQLQQHNAITLQTGELNLGQASLQLSQPDLSTLIGGQEVNLAHHIHGNIDPQTGLLVQMEPSTLQQVPQMIRIDTGVGNQQQTIQVQTSSAPSSNHNQAQVVVQNSGIQNIIPSLQNQSFIPSTSGMTTQVVAPPNSVAPFLQGSDVQMTIHDTLAQNVSHGEALMTNKMYTIHTTDRGTHLVQTDTTPSQADTSNLGQSFQLSLSGDQLSLQPNILLQQPNIQNPVEYTPSSSIAHSQEQITISTNGGLGDSESSGTVTVNVVDFANLASHENVQTTASSSTAVPLQEEEESGEEEEDDDDVDDEDEEELEEESEDELQYVTEGGNLPSSGPMIGGHHVMREKPAMSAKDAAAAIGSIYPCTVDGCDELFTKMQQLSQHQQQKHKSLRPHSCKVCSKSFKRPGHLRDHMTTHDSEQKKKKAEKKLSGSHSCQQCGKSFGKPSQLERHLRTHTGEKPYSCPECRKAFSQKNSLQIHMNVHTRERPHKCPYCDQSFAQKGNLKTHLVRAHKLSPDDVNQTSDAVTGTTTTQEDLDIERLFSA